MSLPQANKPCYIIMQEGTRAEYHGYPPDYHSRVKCIETRTFNNKADWEAEISRLYRGGATFYAGRVEPVNISMSINFNVGKTRRERIPQDCRMDYRTADGRGPFECGKPQGHSGPHGA